jgi:hypothetical protein
MLMNGPWTRSKGLSLSRYFNPILKKSAIKRKVNNISILRIHDIRKLNSLLGYSEMNSQDGKNASHFEAREIFNIFFSIFITYCKCWLLIYCRLSSWNRQATLRTIHYLGSQILIQTKLKRENITYLKVHGQLVLISVAHVTHEFSAWWAVTLEDWSDFRLKWDY